MQILNKKLKLPEGVFETEVIKFEKNDRKQLFHFYKSWRNLSSLSISFYGRSINLPEALSESVFCLSTNSVRVVSGIYGANSSWDCYNLSSKKRIQVKAASVLPDLSSFGPNSQWDELYFIDFFVDGSWSGKYKIYKIPNELVYNHKVNSSQTFRQQQKLGRRPRFSIYTSIIQNKKIKPIIIDSLSKA